MDNIQTLYSMVMGTDASQSQNDPEVRHIAFYLWELLFKDYNEISVELVRDIAKPALEIQNLSRNTDAYAADILESYSHAVDRYDVYEDLKADNDFLNSVTDLCDKILQDSGSGKVPLLITYEELLEDVAKVQNSKLVQVLKANVNSIKHKVEEELYKSLSNNINVALKTVSEIRMLAISTDEEIAAGYIRNRSKHVLECLDLVQTLAKQNIHRAIHEVTLTLKTELYSIVLCYVTIFGSVDANLTSFMKKTIFQFLTFLKREIQATTAKQLMPKHVAEIKQEMQEISQSFEAFGMSLTPLLQEIFVT
ncbi:RNA polymerase sigma factor RpoD [Babesia caballi]|uniref:RNA polymerase sigma factor RpoD n=1 Tax=Babesia caballi TaxID=5871 RepID=A0AAV4LQE8_BABCB|nr:RNA polymerase sigma factor RpoD [Babesia caballi]